MGDRMKMLGPRNGNTVPGFIRVKFGTEQSPLGLLQRLAGLDELDLAERGSKVGKFAYTLTLGRMYKGLCSHEERHP